MADIFYGIDRGSTDVARDSSSPTKDVEVVVDDAVGLTKKDVLVALECIRQAIQEDKEFNSI